MDILKEYNIIFRSKKVIRPFRHGNSDASPLSFIIIKNNSLARKKSYRIVRHYIRRQTTDVLRSVLFKLLNICDVLAFNLLNNICDYPFPLWYENNNCSNSFQCIQAEHVNIDMIDIPFPVFQLKIFFESIFNMTMHRHSL